MRTHSRSLRTLLPALLLGTILLAGCGEPTDEPSAEASAPGAAGSTRVVRVETQLLRPTTFEDAIELTGTVEALNDASLSARASGSVVAIAERGAYVRAGQAVAQLDPGQARAAARQAEAAVEAAQAQFDLAEDNLRRQEPLYRDSVISALEFENVRAQFSQARAQLAQAQAALDQAQDRLGDTRVLAPFSGTVEERFVEPGEQVTVGMPVARVVNTDRVKITAGVPERYARDIEEGTPVTVDLRAYGGRPLRGRVSFVGSAIDPGSRTFPVEIELANAEGALKPQMVATVAVMREQLEEVLVIPRSAVLRDEEGTSVFVVDREDGEAVARRRDVTLGSAYGDRVVVSGLEAGEEVVVLGQTQLTQGDRVEVVARTEPAASFVPTNSDE